MPVRVVCRGRGNLWSTHELMAASAWRCGKTTPVCWRVSDEFADGAGYLILGQVDISSVFEKRQRMQGQLAILDGLDALEIADSTDQNPRR